MRFAILFAAAVAVLVCQPAVASYPCGIYARIDKVEFGPEETKPKWVKVYGDFILVKTSARLSEPERGYMYFSLVDGKEDLCRLEWADLKAMAKPGALDKNVVAFGSAHAEQNDNLARDGNSPNVHKGDAAATPIPYPLNQGLSRLRTTRLEESDRAGSPNPAVLLKRYLEAHPGLPK
ncbi:MAG TPA: hypothetical protein VHR66_08330 [Gemmataceae bacterium]|jgi:hypothetical protein|nr:hypothetical protein [Gemmataceae bacterium]